MQNNSGNSKTIGVVVVIIIVVVGIWLMMRKSSDSDYGAMMPASATGGAQNGGSQVTPEAPSNGTSMNSTDTSDEALAKDSANIDSQMASLSTDATAAQQ